MTVSNGRGILRALLHDTRANALIIATAALIPLAAMVGGGLDMSRLYLAKTRLQQACDAGALGGRKTMGGGTWPGTGNAASNAATNFFNANFQAGAYGTGTLTSAFSESSGKVSGTASVVVPMTLMRIFRMSEQTLTVTCEADMRLPNTDVMFVLDTTGSMAQLATGGSQAKIEVLREAVKCFYEKLARLDTDAVCDGAAPTGGVGSDIQVRFGFVPYATNVNVGRLLPTSYFANSWNYQSRSGTPPVVRDSTGPSDTSPNYGSYSSWSTYQTFTVTSSSPCTAPAISYAYTPGTPYDSSVSTQSNGDRTWQTTTPYTVVESSYQATKTGTTCKVEVRKRTSTDVYTSVTHTKPAMVWTYASTPFNVGLLKNGTSWNSSMSANIGPDGSAVSIGWDGCIEERQTKPANSYSTIPADALDLNIDDAPTSDVKTQWKPALPDLLFTRDQKTSGGSWDRNPVTTTDEYVNSSYYACPKPARKLQTWTASDFQAYVDALTPEGNTYHDIGMLWGARLISRTGLFKSENALTPKGGKIQRNIIFMTDGDTQASPTDYAAYGIHWFDRRQQSSSTSKTDSQAPDSDYLEAQINSRFAAICNAVKNMGTGDEQVSIWVIAFGEGITDAATKARLKACATDDDHYYPTKTAADLKGAFESIANRISQLRLTQ